MQPEPERLSEDEVYERDCQAWNLPRLSAIARDRVRADPADDRSGHCSHSSQETERST